MPKLHAAIAIGLVLLAAGAPAAAGQSEEPEKYLLLATTRTGTMQDELNEAGARGYRFAGAHGRREDFVVMILDPEGRRFRYLLLAAYRVGTLQREMNEAPPEYDFAGVAVFGASFGGGTEAVVVLEAEIIDD